MSKRELRALYAEDDKTLLHAYGILFNEYFSEVYLADNGKDAMSYYKENKPDIVITDINMPGTNGLELVKEIRKKDKTTPVIILSAYSDKDKLLAATELNLTKYLIKPVKTVDLIALIKETISSVEKNEEQPIVEINELYSWDKQKLKLYKMKKREIVEEISLNGKEVHLVSIFCNHNLDAVYTTEQLLQLIWGNEDIDRSSSGKLRRLLSTMQKRLDRNIIASTYKVGYKLIREYAD